MRNIARVLLLVCLSFVAVPALANPEAIVTPLVAKDLPEFQGKEGVMILVEYPLGPQTRSIATTRTPSFMCSRDQL